MDVKKQLKNLPTISGVYLFRDSKREILYIGKAVNLRSRVRSHFNNPKSWLSQVAKIETRPTNSEITALILESQLIKKHRPPYNVQWKDDKNYFYVAVTSETFPRIFITHQPPQATVYGLQSTERDTQDTDNAKQVIKEWGSNSRPLATNRRLSTVDRRPIAIGPFVDGNALKSTLRVLRKIFPFRSCKTMPRHPCLQYHLGRCLAPCLLQGKAQSVKRKATTQNLKLQKEHPRNTNVLSKILRGQKSATLSKLKKAMVQAGQKQNFEQAAKIRDQMTGLEKVLVNSQIIKPLLNKKVLKTKNYKSKMVSEAGPLKTSWYGRVEAYDISNISGESAVGSMIVFENGQPKKSNYRRFKIKTVRGANDIAMIKEVLQRRLRHHEWPFPDNILIDGGPAQLNAALEVMAQNSPTPALPLSTEGGELKTKNYKSKMMSEVGPIETHVFSLAKKQEKLYNTKNHSPIPLAKLKPEVGFLIQRIRNEAHRFALNYHRQLRKRQLL